MYPRSFSESQRTRVFGRDSVVSEQLVHQRVRNGIIECLEMASSLERQRIYEQDVPFVHVPVEILQE